MGWKCSINSLGEAKNSPVEALLPKVKNIRSGQHIELERHDDFREAPFRTVTKLSLSIRKKAAFNYRGLEAFKLYPYIYVYQLLFCHGSEKAHVLKSKDLTQIGIGKSSRLEGSKENVRMPGKCLQSDISTV